MGKVKTKKQKSLTSIIVICFMLVFSAVVGINYYTQMKVLADLKLEEANLLAKMQEEEHKNVQLQSKQDYYASDAYIEKVAREQLGLVMPDEIVFKNRDN